jgi:2-iminobutanoate/2-iminopropanoate deaminase
MPKDARARVSRCIRRGIRLRSGNSHEGYGFGAALREDGLSGTFRFLYDPRFRTKSGLGYGIRVAQSALEKLMTRDIIRTPNAPSPPPTYSQAVRAAGLVFVSGTGPHDPVTGKVVGDTIQEQTRQCLENISAILKAAGTSLERVVSATFIILEETDFAGMNEEWVKWFPANPPARQGAKLPVRIPGMKVSIAAVAEA